MRRLPYIFIIAAAMACTRVPDHVIGPSEMSEVMADMYMAESVVEMNRGEYSTDSSRRALKQSVLAKHGYTTADFDTSLMWYGHHFDTYIKVNERTIEILQQRDKDLGTAIVQSNASFYGDSVDVWPTAKYAIVGRRMPSRQVTFNISSDENWEKGDIYTWRVKLTDDNSRTIRWNMLAEYTDSTLDYLTTTTTSLGWNEVIFAADSTKTLSSLKGIFEPIADRGNPTDRKKEKDTWVDSISLIRKRVNPEFYDQRHRMSHFKKLYIESDSIEEAANDSVVSEKPRMVTDTTEIGKNRPIRVK